jgi:beta-glucosidase
MIYPVQLEAGRSYDVRLDYSRQTMMLAAVRLGCLPLVPEDAPDRAAKLATESDVALVFVGTNGEWESEGFDRPDMELPGDQAALIAKVAAANPRTIVVLNTGSPISMDWFDQVAGVVQAWFPGQECGNAIADVLFGDVNPSGKLTQTYPMRLEDNPAFINYPGELGEVYYGEGIFVGYRYYEKKKITPRLPFGFGLSYTHFHYSNLQLSAAEIGPAERLTVSVDVTNTGDRAGQEVVQLYVGDVAAAVARPEKELKGFAKVALTPGQTKTVTLELDRTALAYYDERKRRWVAEAGEFELFLGGSSQDIRVSGHFTLTETAHFDGPGRQTPVSLDSTMLDILDHPQARAILEAQLGELVQSVQSEMFMGFTLRQLASMAADLLPEAKLNELAEAFAQLR